LLAIVLQESLFGYSYSPFVIDITGEAFNDTCHPANAASLVPQKKVAQPAVFIDILFLCQFWCQEFDVLQAGN
jgi:hypothetical protein